MRRDRATPLATSRPLWFATWAAAGFSVAAGCILLWLHFTQPEELDRHRSLLDQLRRARSDLAQGALEVGFSDVAGSPFRADEGYARLDRAIAGLQAVAARTAIEGFTGLESRVSADLSARLVGFREQLDARRGAQRDLRPEPDAGFFLRLQELERTLETGEIGIGEGLERIDAQHHRRFEIVLLLAAALLGASGAAAYVLGRRQAAALGELQKRDGALQEANRFLSDLIENSAAIVFVKNRDGRYELVNRRWEIVTGRARERVLGRTDADLFPAAIGEQYLANDRQVLETGRTLEVEEPAGTTGGIVRSVRFPLYAADGSNRGVCGMALDITERRRVEAALARSEAQLRTLLNALPDLVWLKDPNGVYLACNARFEHFLGAKESEILGRTDYDFMDRSLADVFRANDAAAVAAGGPRVNEEEVTFASDGHREILETIKTPMFDAEGKLVGVLGIGRDITARKEAEKALRQSEFKYRVVADHPLNWEFWLGEDGRYLYSSPSCVRVMGRDAADFTNDPLALERMVHPEDAARFRVHRCAALAGAPEPEMEFRVIRPDGETRWIAHSCAPVRDIEGGLRGVRGSNRDITERVGMERELSHRLDALRESEERLRLALDAAELGTFDWNLARNELSWNPRHEALWDYAPGEFDGSPGGFMRRLHPDDAVVVGEELRRCREARRPFNSEFRVVRADGSIRWIAGSGRYEYDADGRAVRMRGTALEITARKQAEAESRRNERVLRLFVEHSPAAIAMFDRQMRYLVASQRFLTDFGLPAQNLAGRSHYEVFPEMDEARKEIHRRCLEGEVVTCDEDPLPRPDGRLDYVRYELRPWYDSDGGVGGLIFFSEVVTERKRAEHALRESEEQFRTMFEMASIGIAQAHPVSGRFCRVNRKFCEITGYAEGSLLLMNEAEITHPEDQPGDAEQRRRVLSGEVPDSRLEKRYLRADGGLAWANVNLTLVRDASGQPWRTMAMIEDITARKRLEQEQAAVEAQMRQQQKLESIGTLASGVAHEINNPITGILNYAQLLQDRLPGGSPLVEFTGEIMHETQRVATIVRNLLTFARNERQTHSPARMIDIVDAVLSLVRTVIRRDQIGFDVEIPTDLPQLKCRSQQIQQVIMNLITNARDALNERYPGQHPDKRMRLQASQFENAGRCWIRITIEDHGTGISPEVRERMFDPFFTTKGRDTGTGLGLSISHGIVKEHHGEWTVESEPGRFTRMHVDLPVDNGWKL